MKQMNERVLLAAGLLLACSDSNGRAAVPTTGRGMAGLTVAELADCDEDDAQIYPFQGPAFNADGELVEALPEGHIVATTAGWAIQDDEIKEKLIARNQLMIGEVLGTEGLLGVSFLQSDKCGASRTLSAWRDEESLYTFVLGKNHAEAMGMVNEVAHGWETTHWTEDSTEAPSFAQARKKLAAER
jgi:heme-degrading monooxygenase HmoA